MYRDVSVNVSVKSDAYRTYDATGRSNVNNECVANRSASLLSTLHGNGCEHYNSSSILQHPKQNKQRAVLHAFWASSCSWRVRAALTFKGIPHEERVVDIIDTKYQLTDHYRTVNPAQKVPALEIVIPSARDCPIGAFLNGHIGIEVHVKFTAPTENFKVRFREARETHRVDDLYRS
ncbi:Maleylacetoacetate isomerase [Eumeta japonica]|uniref:Maleylacetoacetate isomerase n=1 Tax=Eumeta variegata TaxID=151549 RepID=A0A4C1VV74_EUMVA|nr:Maleylacetoacetate isomerase [Eumeta japonica]